MRKIAAVFVAAVVVVACIPPNQAKEPLVRESDLAVWSETPLTELETHTYYSQAPVERRQISDGSELWNFVECAENSKSAKCRGAVINGVYMSRCDEAERSRVCCTTQFHVAEGKVRYARVVGQCQTNCKMHPASKPCAASDARL